ncbi:hypothetical protein CCHR01_08688 [Colletotrichum chrysophilum]|uniref:Uncharacterized protein n=1 Tax=Colletotrichum chrysophilum TaxID=1836956 RepID=A0AAD9EHJ1_9PEZI|nr:hypothetical protein CCHR01_08688 [Colletotrichum chrysophilum]
MQAPPGDHKSQDSPAGTVCLKLSSLLVAVGAARSESDEEAARAWGFLTLLCWLARQSTPPPPSSARLPQTTVASFVSLLAMNPLIPENSLLRSLPRHALRIPQSRGNALSQGPSRSRLVIPVLERRQSHSGRSAAPISLPSGTMRPAALGKSGGLSWHWRHAAPPVGHCALSDAIRR